MDNLNPLLTLLAGAFGSFILMLALPDWRRAKVGREVAESDKVTADADTDRLDAFGEFILKMAETWQVSMQNSANTLENVMNTNVKLVERLEQKDKERLINDKIMLERMSELGGEVRKLQDEKDALEETLEAANIKIENLENEVKQLKKDNKASNVEIEKLKAERDLLLSQMAGAKMPESETIVLLVEDTAQTKILSEEKIS